MEEPRPSKRARPLWSKVGKGKAARKSTTGLQNQVVVNFPGPQSRYSADSQNKSKNNNTKKTIKYETQKKKTTMLSESLIDMSLYSEVSVKHMLHEGDQHCLKKFCIGGSDRKVGCSWSQFRGNHGNGIEYVSRSISEINHMRKDDHRAKVTYFIFDFDSDSNDFMSKKLVFADRKVDLYQTVRMEQDIVIINIPNCGDDGMFAM
ncbi:hypothetical protein AYI68_g6530, partial [Smittium mucronatum]